jgi:hypothetical protein
VPAAPFAEGTIVGIGSRADDLDYGSADVMNGLVKIVELQSGTADEM